MNTERLKKVLKVAAVASGLALASAAAQAQAVSAGTTVVAKDGDVRAAHADQVTADVKDGNLVVSGGVADGARIGDSKVQTGIQATLSVPVPTPSRPIPVPTPAQVLAPVTAPAQAIIKVLGF
jgi:hypothetical protein